MSRSDVVFRSDDAKCAAWLYRPAAQDRPAAQGKPVPLVILGHGLGATREGGLDAYARRFVEAGFAALVFDYRHFGASEGDPRQLLDIKRQLTDWAAAIEYARTLDGIDPTRIALWGTSFGGGHVIEAAARDGKVAAVVSQCPFTSGLASVRALGLVSLLKLTPAIVGDLISVLRKTSPVRVKLIGPPRSAALMTSPDAEPGYRALFPADLTLIDEVAARIGLHVGLYRPGRAARRVECPILFSVCDNDTVAPPAPTLRYARQAPRGEIRRYPTGHFDIYLGAPFEEAITHQIAFLQTHLLAA
jgi:fermentation-respiration switch protein FrsA (DUF1100 family)